MNFDRIVQEELEFTAQRGSGPGGQNVNKVSSSCQMQWRFENSRHLTEFEKFQIRSKLSAHISRGGELYLRSEEFRDLIRNKARCVEKLEALLEKAFFVPKKRKASKPSKNSQKRRLDSKTKRSEHKKNRRKIDY